MVSIQKIDIIKSITSEKEKISKAPKFFFLRKQLLDVDIFHKINKLYCEFENKTYLFFLIFPLLENQSVLGLSVL